MNRLITTILILLAVGAPVFAAPPPATEADVSALKSSALAGDRKAIRSLFNLYPRSDGAVSEYIDIVLGGTIRNHPQVFLEELNRASRKIRLDALLGNTGPDLVDRFEEQAVELKSRKTALLTVREASLIEVRDACIRQLDRLIEIVTNAAQQGAPPDRR
jgi:hypothetical protein